MPPPKSTTLKLFEAAKASLKPGESFIVDAPIAMINTTARRIGMNYQSEFCLLVENYKSSKPTIRKVVKVTVL